MALKATIHRVELSISDIDRGYYADHTLTIARHPSETDGRMMVRLLGFALYADDALQFGRGISTDDEPDLWHKDDTGRILHWIDVGLPDERRLRRAAGRARDITVIAYGMRSFDVWWQKHAADLARLPRLRIMTLTDSTVADLERLADRAMKLTCTIQEGQIYLSNGTTTLVIDPGTVQAPATGD